MCGRYALFRWSRGFRRLARFSFRSKTALESRAGRFGAAAARADSGLQLDRVRWGLTPAAD